MRAMLLSVAFMVSLAGCGLELLGTAAIRGTTEAQQVKAMRRQVQNAAGSMGKINLQRAVDTYQAETGAYPATLDVLVPGYLPTLPRRADGASYGYDSTRGRVLDGPATTSAAPNRDAETMAAIRTAINAYGHATGYYPPNLQALVPRYLPNLPSTASGQPFVYNPQNGFLGLPRAAGPQGRNTSRAPGLSPMGEMMTGTSVRRELNRMGSSGAHSAGSYARGSVNGVTTRHNDRQNQVMDELGL